MNFLAAVNRVLVNNFIIRGDDDEITAFTSTQHAGMIRIARNAITTELNSVLSVFEIPYEKAEGSITTEASERIYALPVNFVRFYGTNPFLYLSTDHNQLLEEYKGGEDKLRRHDLTYRTNEGVENWWYWNPSTVKSIALYQVPDGIRTYNFDYEKSSGVSESTDVLPFVQEAEAEAFTDMASRRFKYIVEDVNLADIDKDVEYMRHASTLMNFLAFKNPRKGYGSDYR
ncbi:MAG: hypothetical protein GY941_15820 [Planctomycetes bacterium]|nr:hypothetical protein [Planctomycetota bacterium]